MKTFILVIMSFIWTAGVFADSMDSEAAGIMQAFLKPGANYKALTQKLIPSSKECKAFFKDSVSEKACAAYDKMWKNSKAVIKPKADQTELLITGATLNEIKNGTGGGSDFPGGYKKAVDQIKPGVKIYRFKFVKPGEKSGMSFDGLVKINKKWVFFPKPWRALE